MSDRDWLSGSPALLDDVGVRWLTEEESTRGAEEIRKRYEHMPMGTLWPGDTYEHARELSQRVTPILAGPAFPDSGELSPLEITWYLDLERGELYAALSPQVAPCLWVRCERTVDAIVELAQRLAPSDAPRTKTFRALMGEPRELRVPNVYSGELVEAEPDQLTNYWLFNPYRPSEPLTPATTFSRSLVRCEYHGSLGLYVWDMEYAPAGFEREVAAINERFNSQLPLDLPLDAVGCVFGFRVEPEPVLREMLDETPVVDAAQLEYWIVRIAALRYQDPELASFLLSYRSYPDVFLRQSLAACAIDAGLGDVFVTLRDAEPDPELRERLEGLDAPTEPRVIKHAIG